MPHIDEMAADDPLAPIRARANRSLSEVMEDLELTRLAADAFPDLIREDPRQAAVKVWDIYSLIVAEGQERRELDQRKLDGDVLLGIGAVDEADRNADRVNLLQGVPGTLLRKRSNDYLEYRPDDASDPFRERLEKILKKPVSKKRTTFMIDLDEAVGLMRMEHRTPPCSKWSYRRVKGATPEERLEPFLAERKMGSNSFALEVDLANAIHQVRRRRKSESVGKGNANRLRKRGRPDRTQA